MESPTQILLEQIQTLLIILERPIVQRQLAVVGFILLLNWPLSFYLRRFLRRFSWYRRPLPYAREGGPTLARAVRTLAPAAISLLMNWVIILLFTRWGYPTGFIENAVALFWAWLSYSIFILLLFTLFGAAVRPYQRRILTPLFVGAIGWELLDNFVDLRLLGEIEIFQFFDTSVTLVTLLVAALILYIFITVAWILQNVLYHTLPRRTAADPGAVYSISTISRYIVIALGIIFALQAIGLNLSTLTVIGGGLSIGIGIGLQRIVANFLSGIVLLFEQSLRPGDVIDINGEIGTVEQLNIRATVVRTRNNVEVIVPNENFVTTQVKTYTKSTRETRILLPIGVSYKEDPKEVRRRVLETAARHGLVLKEPEPALLFRGFGESSLSFDLAVWIDQPQHTMRVRSDLYYMVFETFKNHGIEIPFPQRDLNLKQNWEKLAGLGQEADSLNVSES